MVLGKGAEQVKLDVGDNKFFKSLSYPHKRNCSSLSVFSFTAWLATFAPVLPTNTSLLLPSTLICSSVFVRLWPRFAGN